ncbi:MBL fold metallo-hydrolase [Streptomyces sp. STR69]|uniref:MBL fold metallo-hydrolase n=1 Tax=Streptomyces sp. STR69 TaxID=1796942 RepID=UPI0021C76AEE|nr:MBL fold metallo-hydrolase [Streptomyces sp. STR69]
MRITSIGHAGLLLETAAGRIVCDPWFTPAYFGSWVPFPDNTGIDPGLLTHADYLYVSHLHRDHFDPDWLKRHMSKDVTVLLPDCPVPHLRDALADLGFHRFVQTRNDKVMELDGGLSVLISAQRKRLNGMARALSYIEQYQASHVLPFAGPPCFLDEDLFHLNDFGQDDTNVFPDQFAFLDFLREHGRDNAHLFLTGTTVELTPEHGCAVTQIPDEEIARIRDRRP